MTTSTNPLAAQAEALARAPRAVISREVREARAVLGDSHLQPYQWRNLVLAISLGMEARPLLGAVGTRINGETRLAAAFDTKETT